MPVIRLSSRCRCFQKGCKRLKKKVGELAPLGVSFRPASWRKFGLFEKNKGGCWERGRGSCSVLTGEWCSMVKTVLRGPTDGL